MNQRSWYDDPTLWADLRTAVTHNAVTHEVRAASRGEHDVGRTPDGFTEFALAAFHIGRIDGSASVAELVFDSACDPEPAGLTRGTSAVRLLAFRADGYAVDVEIGNHSLLGQLYPERLAPAPLGLVTGQTVQGVFGDTLLDEAGGFELPLPPSGPVRFRADLTGGLTLVTSWLVLRYPATM